MSPFQTVMISIICIFIIVSKSQEYPPQQIHIAIGWTPDRMAFTWTTFDYPIRTWTRVKIDTTPLFNSPSYQEIRGNEYLFVDPWDRSEINRTIHAAYVPNLDASTTYYYQVGDPRYNERWSDIYSFRTGVNAITLQDELPIKYVIFGDLGIFNLSNILPLLEDVKETDPDSIDTIIHVGDLAYDMYNDDGQYGDLFMNMIQPLATQYPYMVCPGNHEKYANFSHYSQRFRGQPTKTGTVWTGSGPTPNNWYYSWNEGLVHWVAISTEIYFNFPWMIQEQYEWLISDLEEANQNRTAAPWIIVYGHKQIYCSDPYNDAPGGSAETLREGVFQSDGTRKYGLEEALYQYGVDFYIAGHQHNYERIYDVYKGGTQQKTTNMQATTYLLVGAAGAKHGLNDFLPDELCKDWSAVRLLSYGYSRMNIWNETHIEFKFIIADANLIEKLDGEDVYETVWYVQENHGPFGENEIKDEGEFEIEPLSSHQRAKKVNLYEKFGLKWNRTIFEPDEIIKYRGDNKEDYIGIEGVYF